MTPRHNTPRVGRVLMATGRDAADVAITTSFGMAELAKFTVVTNEVPSVLPFQNIQSNAVGQVIARSSARTSLRAI